MSLHVRHHLRLQSLAALLLALVGLGLVLAARSVEPAHVLALAGVGCWMVAFAVMLGHAGPRRRR
jgi:hypothetical protein